MALTKRGKYFRYDFRWRGRRIMISTKFTSRELAKRAENRHRELLAAAATGFPEAERQLAEFEARMRGEELSDGPVPTLEAYIPVFLEWSRSVHRPATFRLNRANCEALARHLGTCRVDQIVRADVEAWMIARQNESRTNVVVREDGTREVREVDGTIGNVAINRAVATLRKLYHQAAGRYPGLKNPTEGIQMLAEWECQYIFTAAEWERYLAAARQPLRDVAVLMHERGLRPQDACSLKRDQCDLAKQEINLWSDSKPMLVARRRTREAGKTENSARPIDFHFSPAVEEILVRRILEAEQLGSDYLFPMRLKRGQYRTDRPMLTSSLRKPHLATLKAAGLEGRIRLYDLRHTFARNATLGLMPLQTLQDTLGHASPDTTRRYTGRLDLEAQRKAFEFMEKLKATA